MKLQKLKYINTKGIELKFVTKKIEFFLHYWQYVFSNFNYKFDSHIFKSHRTVLHKVRLQIQGNFQKSRGKIKTFFIDEPLFNYDNEIIKYIKRKKVAANITSLKAIFSTNYSKRSPDDLLKGVDKIEKIFLKFYPHWLTKCLLNKLKQDIPPSNKDLENIKSLSNCFIIELIERGYSIKYIQDIPDKLFSWQDFPYEKLRVDFRDDKSYEEYKKDFFNKLDLKSQLNGINNLIKRNTRKFYVVYRVFDLDFQLPSIKIFDIEFYNPNLYPKLPTQTIKIFEENFSFPTHTDHNISQCNATVLVEGMQEDQLYQIGFEKVNKALALLNVELESKGKINFAKAFLSNETFLRMFGSTYALKKEYKTIDKIEDYTKDDIDSINQLSYKNKEDIVLIDFISDQGRILNSDDPKSLLDFWILYEAYFGKEEEIKKLFLNSYKLYLVNHYLPSAKIFLSSLLDKHHSLFGNLNSFYSLDTKMLEKLGLDIKPLTVINTTKFKNNIPNVQTRVNCVFIDQFTNDINTYLHNKTVFNDNLKAWIDYNLTELYAERNLNVHQKMTDQYFRIKKNEIIEMSKIMSRVLFSYHQKYKKRKSLKIIITIINAEGGKL